MDGIGFVKDYYSLSNHYYYSNLLTMFFSLISFFPLTQPSIFFVSSIWDSRTSTYYQCTQVAISAPSNNTVMNATLATITQTISLYIRAFSQSLDTDHVTLQISHDNLSLSNWENCLLSHVMTLHLLKLGSICKRISQGFTYRIKSISIMCLVVCLLTNLVIASLLFYEFLAFLSIG